MNCISGLTANTPKNLLLDAGAFFKNYDLSKSFAENADKLIGATAGGGSFSAVPTVRKLEVDGAKENVKNLQDIDQYVVTMVANVKEVTVESLKIALGAASSAATSADPSGYTEITGNPHFSDEDYADNITWVGRLAGNEKPVIIQIFNAVSMNGLSLTFADKAEAVIPITLTGCYSLDDLCTPPFKIFYPDAS